MICRKFSSDQFSRLRRLLEGLQRRLQERLFQDTSSFSTSCNHWKDSANWTPWNATTSPIPAALRALRDITPPPLLFCLCNTAAHLPNFSEVISHSEDATEQWEKNATIKYWRDLNHHQLFHYKEALVRQPSLEKVYCSSPQIHVLPRKQPFFTCLLPETSGTGDGEECKDKIWSTTCKTVQPHITLIKFNT